MFSSRDDLVRHGVPYFEAHALGCKAWHLPDPITFPPGRETEKCIELIALLRDKCLSSFDGMFSTANRPFAIHMNASKAVQFVEDWRGGFWFCELSASAIVRTGEGAATSPGGVDYITALGETIETESFQLASDSVMAASPEVVREALHRHAAHPSLKYILREFVRHFEMGGMVITARELWNTESGDAGSSGLPYEDDAEI